MAEEKNEIMIKMCVSQLQVHNKESCQSVASNPQQHFEGWKGTCTPVSHWRTGIVPIKNGSDVMA